MALDASQRNPCVDERMLEGETATEEKRNEVVAPQTPDIAAPLRELSIAIDAVPRQVGAKIGVRCCGCGHRIAGRRNLDDRTWFGVARAERGELGGGLVWKNDQVGLLVSRAVSSRAAQPCAASRDEP